MLKQMGGGSKAFWTMLKKTALFWNEGIPKHEKYFLHAIKYIKIRVMIKWAYYHFQKKWNMNTNIQEGLMEGLKSWLGFAGSMTGTGSSAIAGEIVICW